jgi:hypothetical protein
MISKCDASLSFYLKLPEKSNRKPAFSPNCHLSVINYQLDSVSRSFQRQLRIRKNLPRFRFEFFQCIILAAEMPDQ